MTYKESNFHNESMRDEVNKEIIYNKWADSYEEYVKNLNYKGPVNLAVKLNNYINIAKITNPNILDFGCGTGLLGKEISLLLSNNNIFTLDGIDNEVSWGKASMISDEFG